MQLHALWNLQCASHVSVADVEMSWQIKLHLLPHLLRKHNHILLHSGRTSRKVVHSLQLVQGVQPITKAVKV